MTPSVPPVLEQLLSGLRGDGLDALVAMRPGLGARPAAVLALVEAVRDATAVDQVRLVFVERAHTLRKHAGQIAFPGGAADADDEDLVFTAIREAEEEVGVRPDDVDVLGLLPAAHVAVSGFDVTTVVGWTAAPFRPRVMDPREVASVLSVGIDELVDPANRVSALHPTGYRGPAFVIGEHFLWGLTAHLTDALLTLGGWAGPWEQEREVEVPPRFLTDQISGVSPRADLT